MQLSSKASLLAVLALALHALAQTPAYRIAGHIVSANNQRPLQHATVRLLTTGENKPIATTLSAEDGTFAFTDIKAGAYVLEGNARGFIAANYDSHGGFSTAIVTGAAGVDTESLVLKLSSSAEIGGRVTDQTGDPVHGAMVALYRESHDSGFANIQHVGEVVTDDTGAYDLPHLAPGKYFLSATATPWYAVHAQPAPAEDQPGIVAAIDPALDVAFAETFYPEVTDPTAATAIVLRGGEQPNIDIRLTAQTALTITIPIPRTYDTVLPLPPASNDRAAQVEYQRAMQQRMRAQSQLQFQIYKQGFEGLEPVNAQISGSPNSTEIAGLPPGRYELRQIDDNKPASDTKVIRVNLTDRNTQVEPARGEALGTVKLKLQPAGSGKLEPPAYFTLTRQGTTQAGAQPINGEGEGKGEGEVQFLDPGDYRIDAYLSGRGAMVFSVTADGKTLPGNLIHVAAGATTSVTAIVGRGAAKLEGFAKNNGKPTPGAMIVLLPANPAFRTAYAWRDQSDLDGSFHLSDVPAGRYTLLAIQEGWDLDWRSDEALAHYLPLAIPVVIPDKATTIQLPAPIPVQPR